MAQENPLSISLLYLSLLFSFLLNCAERQPVKETITFAYCILNPRYTNQTVIVDSLYRLTAEIKDTAGISGAIVFITQENTGETTYFVETYRRGTYQDTMKGKWVKPKANYKLFVSFQSDTLTSQTTVPDTFRIISPENFDTLSYPSLGYLTWHKSQGAVVYLVAIFHPDTIKPTLPVVTQDTFFDLDRWKAFYFDTSALYIIKVYAWDENRYRHMIVKKQLPDTLGDGLGHFSSQTQDTIAIYIRTTQPGARRLIP